SLKLTDFGLARMLRSGEARMTSMSRLIRILAYTSPEQFEGKEVTPLADVFTYGVILYYVLAGRHPFLDAVSTNNLALLGQRIVSGEAPSLISDNPEVPAELEQIIFKAIQKDPRQRYSSFAEIRLALAPVVTRLEAAAPRSTNIIQRGDGDETWNPSSDE